MSRNGSGVYSPSGASFPAVSGTLIESAKFNSTINDIATALTESIARDGQTTLTANIPMGGFKLTGLAAGVSATDSFRVDQFVRFPSNKIINGDMSIDQRLVGTSVTPASSSYVLDCWAAKIATASKLSFQQVADAPNGFKFSQKISVVTQTSPAAGDAYRYQQAIEGINCIDLQLGKATAEQITVTFWAKGSIAGTYSCSLFNNAENRSYVGTFTVDSTWSEKTVILTGDTTGTWDTSEGSQASRGLIFAIDLGSGSNFSTGAGAWSAGLFTRTSGSITFVNQAAASTLNITGVQIVSGGLASEFERIPAQDALRNCYRFYEKSFLYGTIPAQNVGTTTNEERVNAIVAGAVQGHAFNIKFKAEKLIRTHTITFYNPSAANAFSRDLTASVNSTSQSEVALSTGIYVRFTQNAATSVNNVMAVHWTSEAGFNI